MKTSNIEEQPEGFPFEPMTALRAITRRGKLLFLLAALSALLGLLVARTAVREDYAAEAVLLHAPLAGDERGGGGTRIDSGKNLANMVELLPNLLEVIRRQALDVSPQVLGRAVEAEIRRDTSVLGIRVTWPDAGVAAAIANDLADVFLAQQTRVRRTGVDRVIGDLERQRTETQAKLEAAADALGRFRESRGALSLDDQIRASITDASTIQSQLDQVTIERQNLLLQRTHMPRVLSQVTRRMTEGGLAQPGGISPVDQTREATRLRNAIDEDRKGRERKTALAGAEGELRRKRRLADMSLIPRSDVATAEIEYARARELALETPQLAKWRKDAEALERSTSVGRTSATESLVPEIGLRTFQIELDSLSIEDKIKYLTEALARTRAKLATFPSLQRQLHNLEAQPARYERELTALEEPLVRARRAASSEFPDFVIVSRAQPIAIPVTRKKLFAAAVVSSALFLVFAGLVLLKDLANGAIRSGKELAHLSGLPVYTQLEAGASKRTPVAELGRRLGEHSRMRSLARRLEQGSAGRATRIMITGPVTATARQRAVDGLLAQFILQDRRIAWISLVEDCPDAGGADRPRMASHPTLHEYLRSETVQSERLLTCREVESVAMIGGQAAVAPQLKAGERMTKLVDRACELFDVVVLVGESLLDAPDELSLTQKCDVVLLLAQAEQNSRKDVQRLARLVEDSAIQRSGWLLLDVQADFVSLEADRTW